MTHARVSLAGIRVGFIWVAGLAAVLVGAPGVRANMQPPTMLLIHVQPWDPNYCDLPGVNSCADLVQTTSATGDLLVVVYMVCGGGYAPGPLTSLDFTLQWGWSSWWGYYGDLANCTDAQFSYEDNSSSVTLHFDWPNHPYPPGFMPLCAFWTNAGGHDCIEVLDDGTIHWGYPQGWYETPLAGKAEAGVDCEYSCLLDCDPWSNNCVPQLTPEELHFELPQGQEADGLLQSVVTGGWAGECQFDATEPWVTLDVTQTSSHTHDVRVMVNALGLAVGEYEARVRATCDARDCSRIYLTVREGNPQDIPEDDAPPPDESAPTTWGGVKELYRRHPTR